MVAMLTLGNGKGTPGHWKQHQRRVREKGEAQLIIYIFFKSPKTRGSPGVFFAREDVSRSQGENQKKKSGMDRSIPEGVGTKSLGAIRAVSWRKLFLDPPQTGGSPGNFFVDQYKNSYQDGSHKKNWEGTRASKRGQKEKSWGPV